MFEVKLENAIMSVLREFQVVPEALLVEFFADYGRQRVISTIAEMKVRKKIYNQPEMKVSFVKTLYSPISTWDNHCAAFAVLCKNRSGEILQYGVMPYPEELFFTTIEGNSYDIAVFDSLQWKAKYNRVKASRQGSQLLGEEDPITHIAAVWDVDLIEHIYDLGFTYFAVINKSTWKCELYESATSNEVPDQDRGDEDIPVDYYSEKYTREALGNTVSEDE